MPSFPVKMKTFFIPAKTLEKQKSNFSRSALFYMKTRVSLKHFENDCLWKAFCPYLALDPSKLNFVDNSDNCKAFHKVLT